MANRPAYLIQDEKVICKDFNFTLVSGLSASQKQKCAMSLHEAIRNTDAVANILEVSTKSNIPLGVKLSAFNLKLNGYPLENIFQSGKVFEHGGPFQELLLVHPREAKHDERLRTSGKLLCFRYQDMDFPLNPSTLFYDYIYIKAVQETLTADEIKKIADYNYFMDIEFNPMKSINTQAKSVAEIRLMLEMHGTIPKMDTKSFMEFHRKYVVE